MQRLDFDKGAYDFKTDIASAYAVERELGELLLKRKKVRNVTYNDNWKYDLILDTVDNKRVTVEVKNDMLSARTGNIGIEFESRGKPSGITRSLADFWFIKLSDGFWSINSNKLKKLIEEEKYFRIGEGGDTGSNTKMFLFKSNVLKPHMKKLE